MRLPYGKIVRFEYDALGRRTAKLFNGHVFRYLWDGNVMVQEWQYEEKDRPQHSIDEFGRIRMLGDEPVENLVTWVYEEGSYVPVAKLQNGERYTIISDYMGRPVEAYDSYGTVVWQADYDIYGDLRNRKGIRDFIPFRQLGQYEDDETRLYYNRFRYYDPRIGNYISQDPIRLMGNNPTLYGYVGDLNKWADVFGLKCSDNLKGKMKEIKKQILPDQVIETFKDGKYKTFITTDDVILYRVYGGKAGPTGAFATTSKASDRIQAKIDAALLPQWGNTREFEATIKVPKGTILNIGKVASQTTLSGTVLIGNADQVLMPRNWPKDWIIDTRNLPI